MQVVDGEGEHSWLAWGRMVDWILEGMLGCRWARMHTARESFELLRGRVYAIDVYSNIHAAPSPLLSELVVLSRAGRLRAKNVILGRLRTNSTVSATLGILYLEFRLEKGWFTYVT